MRSARCSRRARTLLPIAIATRVRINTPTVVPSRSSVSAALLSVFLHHRVGARLLPHPYTCERNRNRDTRGKPGGSSGTRRGHRVQRKRQRELQSPKRARRAPATGPRVRRPRLSRRGVATGARRRLRPRPAANPMAAATAREAPEPRSAVLAVIATSATTTPSIARGFRTKKRRTGPNRRVFSSVKGPVSVTISLSHICRSCKARRPAGATAPLPRRPTPAPSQPARRNPATATGVHPPSFPQRCPASRCRRAAVVQPSRAGRG